MAFEIDFQDVDPNILVLGQSKVVEVKYKVFVNAQEKLKAKFSSKGGFAISGTADFDHNISTDEAFTKKITLVPGPSAGQLFQLQLEVCNASNQCVVQTSGISITSAQIAALLAGPTVSSKEFVDSIGNSMSRNSRYRVLKENNFEYNRSTRNWEKK